MCCFMIVLLQGFEVAVCEWVNSAVNTAGRATFGYPAGYTAAL